MKKILITGSGSYIGTSFEKILNDNFSDEYIVDTVDMIDGTWRKYDFSGYDSVFHVAGIAHRKETKENAELYYAVNRDLAIETAVKAKEQGVSQFVFLSSMSVYGKESGSITKNTFLLPKTHYGRSKAQAECKINELVSQSFKVVILRPPMVYGKGCPGNFNTVVKIVKKLPVFPKVNNRRSMIYIEALCCFVEKCIKNNVSGIYCPQNAEYMNTSEMARAIGEKLGKDIRLSKVLGFIVKCMMPFVPKLRKAFGTLVYDIDDAQLVSEKTNRQTVMESVL